MKNQKPELSVIIPCYNEAENIPLVLKRFKKALYNEKKLKDKFELILVNNNSSDNSAAVLKKELLKKEYFFARTVFQPIPGYGAALFMGLKSAKGEFIGWTHADLQTPPEDAIKALNIIKRAKNSNKTYVKGSRYGRPFFDKLINSIGMSLFETLILKTFMYDINAQPNIFHKSLLSSMKNPPADFAFDLYAYYTAKKNNYNIKRFPVFFGKRIHGKSAWNTGWKSRFKFIKRTLKFSFELKNRLKER
jgi:glycosyltransferase involved in cell wall biosynthesis